jgi:lycopene beta-cyclase
MTEGTSDYDVILVGGGLANGLIADRLATLRPELSVLVIEQGERLGGNHTWSFHGTDLTQTQSGWLAPYIGHRWARQEVRFPGHTRVLATPYCSVTSERFHEVLAPKLGAALRCRTKLLDLAADRVTIDNGAVLTAPCVIDGRGPRAEPHLALGYQKFFGREVETKVAHGRRWPVIMDATVMQRDGYRFVYTLPLDERRLLIEDTYYSDTPALDRSNLSEGIDAYARAQGFEIARDLREEHGVLPVVLAGDMAAFWAAGDGLPRVGLRAALCHPTTGYSLPDAAGLAEALAGAFAHGPAPTSRQAAAIIRAHSLKLWEERGFFRLLNRMLFMAGTPAARVDVLERFYTLPEPLIRRFYRGEITLADKARLVIGRPPVPITDALKCFNSDRAWAFVRANTGAS